jgi:hypothetical protein
MKGNAVYIVQTHATTSSYRMEVPVNVAKFMDRLGRYTGVDCKLVRKLTKDLVSYKPGIAAWAQSQAVNSHCQGLDRADHRLSLLFDARYRLILWVGLSTWLE